MNGFSIVYANCGENLNGTVFCVDLQSPDRLPKLQAGTTCEISSEVDITYSDDYSNMNECRTEGIFLRNWRVTDACGDTIYCTQRINVQFNTILECINPNSSLSCIDELTPETGKGLLFLTQSCLNPSAFIYTPTDDLSNLSELGEGFVIRTWELSHPCGYTRTCSQRINIQNNTDPTVLCEPDNRVQECNGLRNNEAAALSWNEANKKKLKLCSADNCSNVTITSDFDFTNLSDECGFTGTMMVTYIITDLVGNSTTKTATFTITDTTAPNGNFGETNTVINCTDVPSVKDFLMERNTININELTSFSTENCGNLTVTSDFNPSAISENCQSQQETTVTYTLADECDNFETFVWNYTIIDRAISDVLCEEFEIVAINNELIIDNLFAPNSIVKIFDTNWQPIFDCSGDCPESITIPDLNTDEIYHTDIQLYDANWQFICEDKQDITVMGITPPCNVSICTRDLVFRTQEALDVFCGCEVIRGDLYIGAERNPFREIPESNINSLASFRGLRKVEGSIIIVKTQLTDLKGLEELADVHALIISENGQLKSLDGLRKVNGINSTLSISKNPQLNSLAGLSNLSAVGSQLNITENLRLKDLNGLSNLKAAVSISISKNASLESLNGLENLDSLKNRAGYSGSLSISKNTILNDIAALSNLRYIEGNFFVSENPLLENCCPIVHLIDENLANGAALDIISIFRNGIGFCNSQVEVIESCQTSMPCDTSICQGDVFLKTQAEVDAFCGCAVIEGDLMIGETGDANNLSDISDLSNLANLQQVNGNLNISNSIITEIAFNHLTNVGGTLAFANLPNFSNLNGLQKLESIGNQLVFASNPSLLDASALTNLKELGGLLLANSALESIAFLNNLESPTLSTIDIMDCDNLTNLNGLEGVNTIERAVSVAIRIAVNDNLLDISSLENLRRVAGNVLISFNPLLNDCCSLAHLIDGNEENGEIEGRVTIQDNAGFCNSPNEILQNCQILPCDTTSCRGDVVLKTQAEVDAFCGCEVIEGNLVIGSVSTDINNLGSLQGLKVIKQGLVITQTSDLPSLKPLASLREIGGNFIFGANQAVMDFDGLQALMEVGGRFYIENNGIISLAGLQQLTNIGGAFEIVNNYNLTALTNFDKLTYLTELLIGNNDRLLSLEGLNALSVIENTLIIAQNEVLSDCCQILHLIDGNLEEGVVKNGIQIDNNPAFCSSIGEVIITCRTAPPTCENIQIFTENNQIVLEGLMAPNEIAKVFDANYDIIFNCSGDCPETITIPNLAAGGMYHTDIQFYDESWNFICEDKQDIVITGDDEPCDTSICQGDVILRTQAEVDAFCGCEVIEGDLIIGETRSGSDGPVTDIDNIRTITRVTTVKGSLVVRKTGLINLLPLKGVTTIGNTLSISWNPNLVNLQGLEYLKIVDRQLVIESNELLVNFDELSTLEKVGKISLIGKSINSVAGFRNLKSNRVTGLSIVNCDQLKSLNGLEVIDSIADSNGQGIGNLTIAANDMLENMDAVGNIRFAKGLTINQNPVLTNCCAIAHLIDDDLQNGELLEQPFISDNAEFCNSATAIIQNCQTLPPTCENIQILNENNQIIIEGLTAPNEIIKVFDKDFNIIYECAGDCEETQIAGTFPIGNYTVDLQLYDENWALICAEQRGVTLINGNPCNDTDCETIAPILGNIPADLTLECDDSPEISEAITVTDNCDNDVEITFIEEKISGNCSSNYQVIRTWTATDDCGNTASAQQVIVVGDFTAPTLTNLPPDLTFNVEGGFDTTFPILLDNCDAAPQLTIEDVVNPTETEIVRTFTATDNCGNTATAQQIITIIRDEIDLCADLLITTSANSINFAHVDAPNSIVKVFDDNYQIVFDCTATCESELVVPVEGIGIYHTDVQFYDENWAFICKDRQDIEVVGGSEPCDTSICQGDVLLRTQAEVDAFCGCEVIEGNLIIGQRADNTVLATINDLASLVNLKRVNGSINIVNTTIAKLTDLTNLSHVEGTLAIDNNPNLKEVDGLENVKFVGLQLVSANNANLTDLSAWSGIKQIGGGLIFSNSALTSLAFLSNLENDKLLRIEITGCDNLTSLHGLEGINGVTSVIGTALLIASNERLIDLQAIKNIKQVAGGFVVAANPELADCCVIAHLVDTDPNNGIVEGITVIQENGDFCNSVEAIVQNCQNSIDSSCTDINIETTTNSMTISNLTAPIEILKVFDANYKIIYECFADCEATITVPDLVAGKYHLGINFYDEHWQDICELIQTVQIADNALDRNINLLPADFSLYPNPATAETFIDLSKLKGETIQLELFNQFGQKVKQQMVTNVTAQKEKIDLSALQNGVYILQIKADSKRPITKKLMITRLY